MADLVLLIAISGGGNKSKNADTIRFIGITLQRYSIVLVSLVFYRYKKIEVHKKIVVE